MYLPVNVYRLDKTAKIYQPRAVLVRAHGPARGLQALVAEAAHRALRRGNDAIDERLRNVILHLVTADKHVDHVGNVHLPDKVVRVLARFIASHTHSVALFRECPRTLHQLILRTVESRGGVQLLVDQTLQAGDFYPHGRHGVTAGTVEEVKLEYARNVNITLMDDGRAAKAQAQTLVEGVKVPEEDALGAGDGGRVVLERVLAMEAAGLGELGAGRGKVPGDGGAGDVNGIEALGKQLVDR